MRNSDLIKKIRSGSVSGDTSIPYLERLRNSFVEPEETVEDVCKGCIHQDESWDSKYCDSCTPDHNNFRKKD